MEYVHITNEDPGYDLAEKVLEHNGRKVLYLLSELRGAFNLGCGDGSCVQPSEAKTVYVKGYIVEWQHKINEANRAVSEVEPVTKEQDVIKGILRSEHGTSNVYFDE